MRLPKKSKLLLLVPVLVSLLIAPFMGGGVARAAAPLLVVIAPSYTSGPDFATTVLGDPWDMNNSADVDYMNNVRNPTFNGVFRGNANEGTVPDVAFYANSSTSIPTSTYYYLTYRLRFQAPPAGYIGTNGRIIYLEQFLDIGTRRYTSEIFPGDHACAYGAWCVYRFDLRDNLTGAGSPATFDWENDNAEALVIWPHEQWVKTGGSVDWGNSPDWFEFDYVYLTGENRDSADNKYTIEWGVNDGDWTPTTASIYYDNNKDWDDGKTWIADVDLTATVYNPIPPGYTYVVFLPYVTGGGSIMSERYDHEYSYEWDTTGFLTDSYYIWVEINDGVNYTHSVGELPVLL